MSLFIYLFTFTINVWHRKFVTADVTAVFVNDQHGIRRRGQDFDFKIIKKLSVDSYTCKGIKILLCNLFTFSSIYFNIAEYLQKN